MTFGLSRSDAVPWRRCHFRTIATALCGTASHDPDGANDCGQDKIAGVVLTKLWKSGPQSGSFWDFWACSG